MEQKNKTKKELEEATYYDCLKWSKLSKWSQDTTLTNVPGFRLMRGYGGGRHPPFHDFFEPSPSNPMLPHGVLPPLTNEAPPIDCTILK